MAYYRICPKCGDHLDPGEKCDCESRKALEQKRKEDFFNRHFKKDSEAGQLAFVFD